MRILLAYKSHPEGVDDPYTSLLPIGLLSINAALCQAGFDSRVANLSLLDSHDIVSRLRADSPSVVGLSQFTHNRFETLEVARIVKSVLPDCFVLLGGPHATYRWREILASSPDVDAVALGEGEQTMLDLAAALAGKAGSLTSISGLAVRGEDGSAVFAGSRAPLATLDEIPFPGTYLNNSIGVDPRQQLEFIITSRGCPSTCRFCSSPLFWGRKLRFRSPGSMVDEIRFLRDRFGLIYFSIRDDTFTADRKRVIEFCRLLIEQRIFILWNCQSRVNALDREMLGWMKRAGCECIQLGIESGSLRVLESLGKKITPAESEAAAELVREVGIRLSIYLISGTVQETDDDIKATCRLIASMRPSDGQVSPLVYYPGTALFAEAVKKGAVGPDLFEKNPAPAFPVRGDQHVEKATRKLLKTVESAADSSQFTDADYKRQKKELGFCHTTNLMAGEFQALCGNERGAEREYREIITNEPDNPWGWLALGELFGDAGRVDEAIAAFQRLSELVPNHEPAYRALGELFRLIGDKKRSRLCLSRAAELCGG
ncbi:cobalamin-dependent protein [Geobacter pelophilus]|uniref:Cobalamin-dependent protein n=1 Tax=Geoanaerobacter pelophilus TaxID=60036 RepID=A0AAW4L2X4_9BACT|nr:radical SAM protein [Geoanaerobacter pelophilus]MBT0665479.1 cobalamin-dependent protein [Geoanaerobacter pelophilus]